MIADDFRPTGLRVVRSGAKVAHKDDSGPEVDRKGLGLALVDECEPKTAQESHFSTQPSQMWLNL